MSARLVVSSKTRLRRKSSAALYTSKKPKQCGNIKADANPLAGLVHASLPMIPGLYIHIYIYMYCVYK
jgi:hypothetical protein